MIVAVIIIFVVITMAVVSVWVAVRGGKRPDKSTGSINWGFSLCGVVGAVVIDLLLMLYTPYALILFLFLVLPAICLLCLGWLLVAIFRKRASHSLQLFGTVAASLAISFVLLTFQKVIRPPLRWLVSSRQFKAELLAQPVPNNNGLRHMEWEATGFAGVANETIYLVFDPRDSLSAAKQGNATGLPCEVVAVLRLEKYWYSVQFYTDEAWGERNILDCTGPQR